MSSSEAPKVHVPYVDQNDGYCKKKLQYTILYCKKMSLYKVYFA